MERRSFRDTIILFGGVSEERRVSVASAQHLARLIPEANLWFQGEDERIYPVSRPEILIHEEPFSRDFRPQGRALRRSIFECADLLLGKVVIVAFHGHEGTRGKLQKFFERKNIAFTGSGSTAQALAADKVATKKLARKNQISVPPEVVLYRFTAKEIRRLEQFLLEHGTLVMKPVSNGSSIGLHRIFDLFELHQQLPSMQAMKCPYLAEPLIVGRELTVGVWDREGLGPRAIACSEICLPPGGHFDFSKKYHGGDDVLEVTPAHLSPEEYHTCQSLAVRMHRLLGCTGYSRTDIILTSEGPVLLETNTLPGLTKISFIPQQLESEGLSLRDFFLDLVTHARKKKGPAIREPLFKNATEKLADKLKSALPIHVRLSKY